jgi:hypothetical protein
MKAKVVSDLCNHFTSDDITFTTNRVLILMQYSTYL